MGVQAVQPNRAIPTTAHTAPPPPAKRPAPKERPEPQEGGTSTPARRDQVELSAPRLAFSVDPLATAAALQALTHQLVTALPDEAADLTPVPSVHGGPEDGEGDWRGHSTIRSVLIVEDSSIYLRLLSRHVQSIGCRVVESASVESALCVLVHERPDLILTDLLLPGLDGLDLVTVLQAWADWRDIPVVVHSKANTQDLVQVMTRLGVHDYILKPLNPETAIPRLTEILASLPPPAAGRSLAPGAKAQGQVPVLLVTQSAEFATLVRHEANPLYDVILVESGPAALAAAIQFSPWMIFVTPEIATWDMARTMIKLRAVKTLARIPIIPLVEFNLGPVQAKLNPPFTITRDPPRTTVTLGEIFTQGWLHALWVALHRIVGSETEELVFEGPSMEAGYLVEVAWVREFAQSLGVRAFRKVKEQYVPLSDRQTAQRMPLGSNNDLHLEN